MTRYSRCLDRVTCGSDPRESSRRVPESFAHGRAFPAPRRSMMIETEVPQSRSRLGDHGEENGAHAPSPDACQTGMPRRRALSARLSVMPLPGKTINPAGMTDSISSLRRKGAALACLLQFGLKMIWVTLRASAQQAAMRSAPFGAPPCSSTIFGVLGAGPGRAFDQMRS